MAAVLFALASVVCFGESLWGVLLAASSCRSELVGTLLALGATLVVASGALIGASRCHPRTLSRRPARRRA